MSMLRKINDIDLKLLRIFQTVADCGGFSAAESQLNIARSTISTHMADLESRLGLTLCQRGRAGFALTEEGKTVYDAVQALFGALDLFRREVNGLHDQVTGELNIICSDAIVSDPRFKLTETLARFCEQAPDVVINISTNSLPEMEQALIDGRADICFAPRHRDLSSVKYTPLYSEDYFLYCHKRHPLFDADEASLSDERLAASPFIHPGIQTVGQASLAMEGLRRSANAYIYEVRMALVATGHFIGFFPSHYVQPWLTRGEMRALCPATRHYAVDIAALTRRAGAQDKVLALFQRQLATAYNL
ncbi:LysR family transcriptional regulator [Simiduia aestuariiviva]|uniref:DNA-binding transcriptional LysR family regulator n=1 Tax=Simiduia aestuariiviva TaxID=1510459 RepID=A0A839UQZ4_9GAMM|nr:LysR family transcriptional regulator [Simiduia aestuariiviva]MBB3167795.1 DNA-binding transcriptional LysR family regulator [Simiduia aestuariiviva]